MSSLDTARSGHTASLLTDGTVLVVGGDDGHGHALKSCERWDPRTGKWTAAAHLLARRHGHAATLLADGTLLVTAGRHKNYAMKQFWETPAIDVTERYDPVADTWTRGANMPGGGRFRHGAVLLADGRVFVAGGFVGIDAEADPALLRAALLYRPVDDTWAIVDHVLARASRLRAIVFECEKNRPAEVVPVFEALRERFPAASASVTP